MTIDERIEVLADHHDRLDIPFESDEITRHMTEALAEQRAAIIELIREQEGRDNIHPATVEMLVAAINTLGDNP